MKKDTCIKIERRLQSNVIARLFTSHTALCLCYGVFLMLYEVNYLRKTVPAIHPLLIGWAGVLALYDIFIRKVWKKIPMWPTLLAFIVVAGITAVINRETGLVGNLKSYIMAALPLVAFLPLCLLCQREKREKALLTALSGGALVIFLASAAAVVMYLMRISTTYELFGISHLIGYRYYIGTDPSSGMILYGLYTDTNHAAAYAVVFSAYSFWLLDACRRGVCGKAVKVFAIANLVVQLCYFPLANSRGGWLSLAVAAFICVFLYIFCVCLKQKGNIKRFCLSMISAAVVVMVLCGGLLALRFGVSLLSNVIHYKPGSPSSGEQTTSLPTVPPYATDGEQMPDVDSFQKANDTPGAGRLKIWKEALQLYSHNPVLGVGPGNATYFAQQYQFGERIIYGVDLHNSYLDLLVDYGAVGFLALLGFFAGGVWIVLRRFFQKEGTLSWIVYLSAFCVVFLACISMFLSCIFISTTAMYFLLLCILSFLIAQCNDKDVKE